MADQATNAVPTFELRHRLERALEWSGVTPAEMAERLEVSETTIRNYRTGRTTPTRATLRDWALMCGVPFSWLAYGEVDLTDPDGGGEQPEAQSRCTVLELRPRHDPTAPLLRHAAA